MTDQPIETTHMYDPDIDLKEPIQISYSPWQGVMRMHVRHYYYTKAGELRPTQKGVSFPLDQHNAVEFLKEAIVCAAHGLDIPPQALVDSIATAIGG